MGEKERGCVSWKEGYIIDREEVKRGGGVEYCRQRERRKKGRGKR